MIGIIANIDKHEYLQQTKSWLAHLAILQGSLPPDLLTDEPLIGSWSRDTVEVVLSGTRQHSEAITELDAIYALQGKCVATVYWRIKQDFKDIGKKLGQMIARHAGLQELCFKQLTGPGDLSSLTTLDVQSLLYGVRNPMGNAYFRKLKDWLIEQPTLPANVKEVLERSGYYSELSMFDRQQPAHYLPSIAECI